MLPRLLLMFQLLFINPSLGNNSSKELIFKNESSSQFDKSTEIFGDTKLFVTTTTGRVVEDTGTMEVQKTTKYPKFIPVINPGSRHNHQ